jgi:hypothetical protein
MADVALPGPVDFVLIGFRPARRLAAEVLEDLRSIEIEQGDWRHVDHDRMRRLCGRHGQETDTEAVRIGEGTAARPEVDYDHRECVGRECPL